MFASYCKKFTGLFPLWVVLVSALSYLYPDPVKPWGAYVPYYLAIVMLCMGLTMQAADFKLVFSSPRDVMWGVIPRFVIMPFVGFSIAKLMGLPPALAAGLILVGCCPSAVASNVMTFLSKGDTPLSVTVSSVNTILAPLLTPALFLLLAGSIVPVNAQAMLIDIAKVVLLPITIGVVIRQLLNAAVEKIMPALPSISTISLLFIIGTGVAMNAGRLASVAIVAFLAVVLHNAFGLLLGYLTARKLGGLSLHKAKAITFEIGMENSGLAVGLALAHLDPMAAIPGAIFSAWHNLTGSALASYWSGKAEKEAAATGEAPSAEV
ncbi:MAG: bile acid:sodium symporter family protein [Negativicutes bacterium]|nr:bile acid:sodium symporter family protein [Negativicutes bacterium]